jgi:CheY-like chemotaxis protein
MTRILLVEDEDPKLKHIEARLRKEIPFAAIDVARSVNSAISYLEVEVPDLIVLDMSLPTFDVTEAEGGGRPQGFGGVEVLRFLAFSDIETKVIVITGYEAFPKGDGQVNLSDLEQELVEEFPTMIASVLRFNSAYDLWKVELDEALMSIDFRK